MILGMFFGMFYFRRKNKCNCVTGIKYTLSTCLGIIIYLMMIIILFIFPIENTFYSFDSPEGAYKYNHAIKDEVYDVIEGQESCLVLSSTGMVYAPKSDNRYKLSTPWTSRKVVNIFLSSGLFTVDQVVNTSDYYVHVLVSSEKSNVQISDTLGTKFICQTSPKTGSQQETNYDFYGYIKDFSEEGYSITIDGRTIKP